MFTSYYGIGIEPPPRGINSVYLYFLLGWFYNVALLVRYVAYQKPFKALNGRIYWVFGLLLLLNIANSVRDRTGNLRTFYGEWLYGHAAAYDRELYDRYEFIKNSPDKVVYVKPLQTRPRSLFVDDLNADPTFLWNRCVSGYFGKEVIELRPKPTQ
jgi:hypothetical protein